MQRRPASASSRPTGRVSPYRPSPPLSWRSRLAGAGAGGAGPGVRGMGGWAAGPVPETHDLLFDSGLSIERETLLPIRHCLVARPGTAIEDIRVIRSHPMALDQCREL